MELRHHGYLLTGDVDKVTEEALEMAEKILEVGEGELKNHPDLSFFDSSVKGTPFTVDEARKIRELSSKKSFLGKGRIFIIKTNAFTREAGNALLKTIEEPAGTSYFFIITGSPDNLLSTLRSRLFPITFYPEAKLSKDRREIVENFLRSSSDKRMAIARKLAKEKEKTLTLLDDLELFFRGKLTKDFSEAPIRSMDEIGRQKDLLRGRSSSPKMILEHLSLTLPRL